MKVAVLASLFIAACGGPNKVASHSPSAGASPTASASASSTPTASPSTSPAPAPKPGNFGVLVGNQAQSTYTVSLIAADGKVAASAQASTPPQTLCPSAVQPAGAPVSPPVSTSDYRAYFMDAAGVVRFLTPGGQSGTATTLTPNTPQHRSMFAVSPDDRRIAVIVNDYSSSGASTRLYIEDLNGGTNHIELYKQSGGRTLWPVGWHGTNNLVLAVVVSCTNGGGPFCCGMQELHVVDPETANRRFTIGSANTCLLAGPPSPAGAVCEDPPRGVVLNWTAGTVRTFTIPGPVAAYLSPNGANVALVDNNGTTFTGGGSAMAGVFTCAWIDDSHVLAGGDAQQQPRVADVTSGAVVPVAAQGDCVGRIPGGL